MQGAQRLATGDTLPTGGRNRFVIRQQNESLGWSLVALIPEDVMYLELNRMQSHIVTAALAALIVGLVMILFISGMVTRPFRALTQSMARAGEGDLRLSAVNSPIREIDQLAAQYDLMLGRIASLIQRIRTIEQEKRTSELQALRSQINPHFTYNTLDSIRWMAMMQNAPKVAEMISRLVKLLKLTTGRRGEFVKVSEEFEQTACYSDIIRFRYNCRIDVVFDLRPEVENARTLGLLLQPIVENSFVHGFDNFERPGVIRVSAYQDEDALVFAVEDNGRGMELPKDELPASANQDGAHLHAGIGISNVNSRIQAWFGEGYGVSVHSSPSKGTTVRLTQPLAAFSEREEET
jgi:two-component system sensor histidine kinase YesM